MGEFIPYATYSEKADALYVYLSEGGESASTKELDSTRLVDYAPDGRILGVEFLDVSEGVDLSYLPSRELIEKAIAEFHLRILA